MPQDETTVTISGPGRRRLSAALLAIGAGAGLTSGIAAGVATTAAGSGEGDVILIAVCTAAEDADNRSIAAMNAVEHLAARDPRSDAAYTEASRIFGHCRESMNTAALMPASTPAGLRAKASLALREMNGEDQDALPLVHSVLLQLAGRA